MNITPANSYQQRAAAESLRLLRDALSLARIAKCPRLVLKIERAVASARGAVRHVKECRAGATRTRVYGVLHPMQADRRAFAEVETPDATKRWYNQGQYA